MFLLSWLPLILIIVFVVHWRKQKKQDMQANYVENLKEIFSGLSLIFGWYFVFAINRKMGTPVGWQLILLGTIGGALALAYLHKVSVPLIFSLFAFPVWWVGSLVTAFTGTDEPRALSLLAGVVFMALGYYGVGSLHGGWEKYKKFAGLFVAVGLIPILMMLFFMSSKGGLQSLERLTGEGEYFASVELSTSVIAFGLGALALVGWAYKEKRLTGWEAGGLVVIGGSMAVLALSGNQDWFVNSASNMFYVAQGLTPAGIMWLMWFNVLLFGVGLGYVLLGIVKNEEWPINLGVGLLSLFIIVKYFDWFFSFLDKSVFFIGAGVLLLGLGWFLEKSRKALILKVKEHGE